MTAPLISTATSSFNPEPRLFIAGQLREASGGTTAENVNPATEEVLGVASDGTAEDMEAAIAAARRAFDTTDWSTNHEFRQHCLLQLHQALQDEKEDIRAELVAEVGSTLYMTTIAQLEWPLADAIHWPAQHISSFPWERAVGRDTLMGVSRDRIVVKEAMGVVAAITPWNFPFEIISNKLGQALATGNTVVLKPAIETPWSALRWGRIIAEKTDIPAGVVNIVTTSDNAIAQQLLTDPRVDMISFTGSSAVGQLIQRLSGDTMKRNLLELGGKSAYLILEGADLQRAMPGCIGALMHSGQGCALATRLVVPRSMYDQAVDIATGMFGGVTVGDPSDPATFCGPLVSAKHQRRVLDYIDIGRSEGARLTVGGGRPDGLDRGYYVAPTIFADVTPQMRIFREEIFGPVLTITAYDGGDDGAVTMANDSMYGLAAYVAGPPERAAAVARRLRSGWVNVNGASCYGADAPFGGYKLSGIGRQGGAEGFEQYLQTKVIATPAPAEAP
ncbi:aldehyde dehydrogenase family protein [Mycobacterium eburneum]|nr:aldehyde dehydrogenase family protein [Mycobacterium eburneum]TDH52925.1 aldehyde dehydrogenase family protein [Mycobacterium eburneum]